MTTLDDLARVEREYRERPKPDNVTGNSVLALKLANTIAAYVAAQRERDAVIRDLTEIVRMPNVEYVADRHNRAVELLRAALKAAIGGGS